MLNSLKRSKKYACQNLLFDDKFAEIDCPSRVVQKIIRFMIFCSIDIYRVLKKGTTALLFCIMPLVMD